MALTIQNQPTYPNAAYTNLVYTVTSVSSSRAQYQYVMDVTQGGQILSRIKQYPNPQGAGVFDPSRILNDYIEYDQNWKTSGISNAVTSKQDFIIYFGEEYGTSPSSSVAIYDGSGNIGSPGVTGTPTEVIGAVVDPNNGTSFNWDRTSRVLSNIPTGQDLAYTDYNTLSFYNDGDLTNIGVNYNPGLNLSYTPPVGFFTIPVSVNNIGVAGTYSTVTVTITGTTTGTSTIVYNKAQNCNYDRVRFAFINEYGFWDYFGVNLPYRRETRVDRNSIRRSNVDYSSNLSQYNPARRGKDFYNIKYEDTYTISTDWIDQDTASWLSEMIESPSVFVQEGTNFIPITITNASYVHNTNRRGQKTFEYQISYQYANQRPGR
jgi:hypothetical protein